ncbi:apyrase-like isoform X2 [Leptidea sinapis]|uniref:apyrase-like isoform X2 n=1 Tax=Leptidea sinapis TaxID=189913 RepID=UPI0021273313|nr:apyrase-like isoform X2 [Leptidea sinapis]
MNRFEETSDDELICKHGTSCFGGLPRMVYEIEALQRENPDSLLLEAGDSFQGTYWYTALKWNVTQYFLNLLNHDAHAIGNHEFDDDVQGLVPYLASLRAPTVAANLDSTYEPSLQGLYKPYVIVERNGRKIGIVGVTTTVTEVLAPTGRVIFKDPREAAYRESKLLNDQGIDIIILLSHCGYSMDVEIAREYGRYIDVIVGGHSHRDKTEPFPYLTRVATSSTNHEVIVVQADAFTKVLGNLSLYFDDEGDVQLWQGGEILLDQSIPEDLSVKKKMAPFVRRVHAAAAKPIGYITTPMNHKDCLYGECLMGNFLADVLRHYGKTNVESPYHFIALIQRSNMRAAVPAGAMTEGEVVELFPYFDPVESFELQGKYILEALERSVSDLMQTNIFMAPWLLQVSGLQVIYNISKPEGSRVDKVFVVEGSFHVPLEAEQTYQIVATSYLTYGGDGYAMMDKKRHLRTLEFDQTALRKYIKTHCPIHVYLERRIVIYN